MCATPVSTLRCSAHVLGVVFSCAFHPLSTCVPSFHPQLYPEFFCRYDDPSYLKALKIEVLIAIADQTNAYEIAEEMTQVGGAGWVGG